jgi:hypothetical protein
MSNYLAIATVTAGLVQLLNTPVGSDVNGAIVTSVRPNANGNDLPTTGVNLYLYQVTPNAHWRNEDLPTRRASGQVVQRPRLALDLHYLFSFYGDDSLWEPQRVLGSTMRTLHTQPQLTRQEINAAINSNSLLAASNLADETELVKLTPLPLTLDELSKLWSVFFQLPYVLSVAYQATVVFIESEDTPRLSLPVRQRNLYVMPFRQPLIETAAAEGGVSVPLLVGGTLVIRGRNLRGDVTQVRLGENMVTPPAVTNTEIRLPLADSTFPVDSLRAGMQGVQVIHHLQLGTPPEPHHGFESNVAPFVLRPSITAPVTASVVQDDDDEEDVNDKPQVEVTVSVVPPIGRKQRVILLLNENVNESPAAYTFLAEPRKADVSDIKIRVRGVKPGTYLVRLQVDGAETLLQVAADPDNLHPKFVGPEVVIP